ncbi:MAG: hypothetical protein V4508_27190 [Pseudomonadota bacterium]
MGSYATLITYHPNVAINTFSYGNGVTHSLTQNLRGLPDTVTEGSVLNDQYSFDANANVAGIADLLAANTSSRTMGYDNLDRLTTVSAPNMWGSATYGYDALDNLVSSTLTAGGTARTLTHTINATTNRIDSTSGGPAAFNFGYTYDSQGNITQRGAQAYVFDQGNPR